MARVAVMEQRSSVVEALRAGLAQVHVFSSSVSWPSQQCVQLTGVDPASFVELTAPATDACRWAVKDDPLCDVKHLENLRSRFNAGEALKYVFFWGHRPGKTEITAACFSQWYDAAFVVDGQRYPTAEHFMMAEKAAIFADQATRAQILQAPNPGAAKALGRQVRGFDEVIWLEHRFSIVVRANQAKFAQNPALGQFLKQTGSHVLVEASPLDKIWGIGLAQDDEKAHNPNLWRGLNLLGFALMRVRDDA